MGRSWSRGLRIDFDAVIVALPSQAPSPHACCFIKPEVRLRKPVGVLRPPGEEGVFPAQANHVAAGREGEGEDRSACGRKGDIRTSLKPI